MGIRRIILVTFILEIGAYGVLGLELLKLGHMVFKTGAARTIKIWPYRG